jgi:hypothetical protein
MKIAAPKLGQWNWPELATEAETLVAEAKGWCLVTLTPEQQRLVQLEGPVIAVVLVAIWFAWLEARDGEKF